jgi:hypothetical protein
MKIINHSHGYCNSYLPEMDTQVPSSLMIFHCACVVEDLPTRVTCLVPLVISQETISLSLTDNSDFDLWGRHMNV